MTKKSIDKTPQKRQIWVERTAKALQSSEQEVRELLATPRRQSLRINSLQAKPPDTLEELTTLGWRGKQYDWMKEGYSTETALSDVRDSHVVAEGRVFIQNAASWLPVLVLGAQRGESILDVCAAPGGKTSHIAAMTDNQARIYANDNSRARLAKLRANMERLGAWIEEYTLFDATHLARKLDGQQFDRILLDAPCSGEGLMNIDKYKDFTTWSVAHIKRLQQLQKRILTQSWELLRPGGVLVYSTCTMAPEENEAVIDYMIRAREDAEIVPLQLKLPNRVATVQAWNGKVFDPKIQGCMRLTPSENIEAFFVCKFRKIGDAG